MINTGFKIILAMTLMFSLSTNYVNAQFWKKKPKTDVKDTAVALKDTTVAAKDTALAVKKKPVAKQDTAFAPGDNQLSIAYGFIPLDGDVLRWLYQVNGSSASIFGPLYLKYEYAITYNWTIGVNFAFGYYNITSPSYYETGLLHYEFRVDYTYSLLCRINYHLAMIKKWDPYIGGGLGVRTSSSSYTSSDPSTGVAPSSWDNKFPVGFEATAGARYIVNTRWAFFAEAGLAKSLLQFGATFKMK